MKKNLEHLPREGTRFSTSESQFEGFCPRCLMTEEEASEKDCYYPEWLSDLLLQEKQELIEKIENLIVAEISIARQENQQTSRLTSLMMKIKGLLK